MNLLLILFLTVLNGLFAMSEMALAASRKARLDALAAVNKPGATAALALMEHPTNFLSTVQVGITSIGLLNGIVGDSAFSERREALAARSMRARSSSGKRRANSASARLIGRPCPASAGPVAPR